MEVNDEKPSVLLNEYNISQSHSNGPAAPSQPFNVRDFRKKFKIVIVRNENYEMEFDLIGIHPFLANTFRRLMLSDVPSMAIEKVYINNNTSIIQDEVLAHRLGLIPLKANPTLFEYKTDANAESSENDTLEYELKIKCSYNKESNKKDSSRAEDIYKNNNVYSKHIKWVPVGSQKERFRESEVGPIDADILIAKMRPGHELDLKLVAVKGCGRDHAKFSPVATAFYRLLPDIKIVREVEGEAAYRLQNCFSPGVIAVRQEKNGKKIAVVNSSRYDTCSRNIFHHEDLKDAVVMSKIQDHFIFSIESVGAMQPEVIFKEAVKILRSTISRPDMSQAIKIISNLAVPHYTKYGIIRHLCFNKELVKSTSLTPGPDFLLQNLKNASSPKTVLKLVNEHYNILNSKHIMQALRSLFDLQKDRSSEVSAKDIIRHPDFERICRKLKSQSGVIELNETIEALKIVSYVGVPSNSTIVQVLLQLIRQNINSLNLPHIMFLDFLLQHFKSSPLVDALKIALPIVFEIQLPIKMDREDASHLAEYLHFASKTRLGDATIDTIVKALYNLNEQFDAKTARSIIWSICDMEPNDVFEPLINKAVNDLIVNIDNVPYSDLETTLGKMVRMYSKRYPFYYNEVFADTCANYIIDHDLGFENATHLLRKLGRVTHINKYLLDYVSKKAQEDHSCVEYADAVMIYSIAISTSLCNYRPVHWENLKSLIIKKKSLASTDRRQIIWIRFAASLCLLDIYKIDVLTKALNPGYLDSLFKKGYMSDFENYFTIWYSIKLNRPELCDILPDKFNPEKVIHNMRDIPDFPLEASLQKGLGAEQYVTTNLVSKKGYIVDHAILFRKGGYPVAINNEEKPRFVEDIETNADNELLLIMALRPIHYTINTKVLKESMSLAIKILEMDGHSVLPINLEAWESLSEFEKIPYLMQQIRSKLDSDILISESEGVV
ncbi:hypothetical protein NQ315_006819 [Exocentrus adspersus]|uniref:DNA-directed RNA polymerases I and III subunit RPAC1 n=1 Tax=Exocentrus adspersus TaxID=1586481 RepID=A0AAV8WCJ4_9CUCU|nr:hypothetical protein NQ315_006819 [Exocentrus adspersus]